MNPAEIVLWVTRLASVIPQLIELWNVLTGDTPQPDREIAAALEVVRAVKAAKAREEFGA